MLKNNRLLITIILLSVSIFLNIGDVYSSQCVFSSNSSQSDSGSGSNCIFQNNTTTSTSGSNCVLQNNTTTTTTTGSNCVLNGSSSTATTGSNCVLQTGTSNGSNCTLETGATTCTSANHARNIKIFGRCLRCGATSDNSTSEAEESSYVINVPILGSSSDLVDNAILKYANVSKNSLNSSQRLALFNLRERIITENVPIQCTGGDINASVQVDISKYSNEIKSIFSGMATTPATSPSTPSTPTSAYPSSYIISVAILSGQKGEIVESAILTYAGVSKTSLNATQRLNLFHLREQIINQNVPTQCTGGDANASVQFDLAAYASQIKEIFATSTTTTPVTPVTPTPVTPVINNPVTPSTPTTQTSGYRCRECGLDLRTSSHARWCKNSGYTLNGQSTSGYSNPTSSTKPQRISDTPSQPSTTQTSGYRCRECGLDLRTSNHAKWCKNTSYQLNK